MRTEEVKEEGRRPSDDWEIPFDDDDETAKRLCRAGMMRLDEEDPWYDD